MKEDDFCTIFQGIKVRFKQNLKKFFSIFFLLLIKRIQELYEIHKDFHLDLIKACSQYSSLRLSDVFLNWKDKFLVYADYCANLTTAQDRIQDICNQNEHINREVNV